MTEGPHHRAFTLIQALVVIAMIVVLIALLVPAISSGIYYASLSRCGSHLKSITIGANTYAAQHNRLYLVLPRVP